jgi:hypothetical protein
VRGCERLRTGAELEEQHAARRKSLDSAREDALGGSETRRTAGEANRGLVAILGRQRRHFALGNIRRIGDDHAVAGARRRKKIGLD